MKTNFRNLGIALFLAVATIGVNATELNKATEIESSLKLEDWMIDNTLFETKKDNSGASNVVDIPVPNPDFSILAEAVTIEIEPIMELESWMTDAAVFDTKDRDGCPVK